MKRASVIKLVLAAVLIGGVTWFYTTGQHQRVDPNQIRDAIRAAGPWGRLLFVGAYALTQPLGMPSTFFLLSAPLIWSPVEAFLLSWTGTLGTSVVSYSLARFVARDWVQRRLPQGLRRFDDRLEKRGFVTVLLLRLVFYTNPTVQYGLGVSRIRIGVFLWGTALGVIPYTLLMTFVGVRFNDWIEAHPLSTWPWAEIAPWFLAGLLVAVVAVTLVLRWRSRTKASRIDVRVPPRGKQP